MCTALSFCPDQHYFGRNLDLDHSYNETVTITPRNYPFIFRNGTHLSTHYAIIGMATVVDDYPLYYDATNEAGLSMAGLNFPNNAHYFPENKSKTNISPFEFIPWILCKCTTVSEAVHLIVEMNLWNKPFNPEFPLSPLHWIISDRSRSVTVECTAEGLQVYDNPVGVLTNNPPFPYHLHNLANYMQLTPNHPQNNQPIELKPYSLGMGSFGLPGDMSSGSRFVKAAFTKMHSKCESQEEKAVSQFFHILGSVCQQRGLTETEPGKYEYTLYSSCCNTDKGIYYYTTYDNSQITAIDMHAENLDGNKLTRFELIYEPKFLYQNRSSK